MHVLTLNITFTQILREEKRWHEIITVYDYLESTHIVAINESTHLEKSHEKSNLHFGG